VPARCILGAGEDEAFNPEMLEDYVLVDLGADPESTTIVEHVDEYIMNHHQREEGLQMKANDFNVGPTATHVAQKRVSKKRSTK